MLTTFIGVIASVLTTISYMPQLSKAWRSGQTDDLSLKMLSLLLTGLVLWVIYGLRQADWVIVLANGTSSAMLVTLIVLKLRSGAART